MIFCFGFCLFPAWRLLCVTCISASATSRRSHPRGRPIQSVPVVECFSRRRFRQLEHAFSSRPAPHRGRSVRKNRFPAARIRDSDGRGEERERTAGESERKLPKMDPESRARDIKETFLEATAAIVGLARGAIHVCGAGPFGDGDRKKRS